MLCLVLTLALTAANEKGEPDWWHGEHFTSEWGGARTWPAEHGLTVDLIYALEVITNAAFASSGDSTSVAGHLDLGLTLDFEKLGLWKGGRFFVLAQNGHGRGSNEFVGSSTSTTTTLEGTAPTRCWWVRD